MEQDSWMRVWYSGFKAEKHRDLRNTWSYVFMSWEAADCREKLFSSHVRRTEQPHVSGVSYLVLVGTCPRHLQFCLFPVIRRGHLQGPRPVCDISSHSPTNHKGLCLCFLPLMRRAKVLGWMGALGNQSRHADLSCLAPERLAWLGNPWGPVWKVAFLISLWSGSSWHIWKDKEWFVFYMCFHLFLQGRAKALARIRRRPGDRQVSNSLPSYI